MQHDTLGGKRLYALIGDDVRDLPSSFLQKLELLLQRQHRDDTPSFQAQLTLVGADEGDGTSAELSGEAFQRWRKESIVVRRTLQSLSAILEILQAAHMDVPDEQGETMLAPHLVEGLLAAGRGLADTTLKTLDGAH